jgi:hypothetical protein
MWGCYNTINYGLKILPFDETLPSLSLIVFVSLILFRWVSSPMSAAVVPVLTPLSFEYLELARVFVGLRYNYLFELFITRLISLNYPESLWLTYPALF